MLVLGEGGKWVVEGVFFVFVEVDDGVDGVCFREKGFEVGRGDVGGVVVICVFEFGGDEVLGCEVEGFEVEGFVGDVFVWEEIFEGLFDDEVV